MYSSPIDIGTASRLPAKLKQDRPFKKKNEGDKMAFSYIDHPEPDQLLSIVDEVIEPEDD